MEFIDISDIIFLCVAIITSVSAMFTKTQKNLRAEVVNYIGEAEEKYSHKEKAGANKQDYVVEHLTNLVPLIFRPFFTKSSLAQIVRSSLEDVEQYTQLQLENMDSKTEEACSKTESDIPYNSHRPVYYTCPYMEQREYEDRYS